MKSENRIVLIGAGKLGSRIARRILRAGVCEPGQLAICRRDTAKLAELTQSIPGCRPVCDMREAIRGAQLVILAVRPSDLAEASRQIRPALLPGQTVLSVVTGKSFATLSRYLGTRQLLRASTSILVEAGASRTAFMTHPEAGSPIHPLATKVMESWGEARETRVERDINTAIVAIGALPGMIAHTLEGFVEAIQAQGWSRVMAEREVQLSTLALCAKAQEENLVLHEIWAAVATEGGITRAGSDTMDKAGVRSGISQGIEASLTRTEQLDG